MHSTFERNEKAWGGAKKKIENSFAEAQAELKPMKNIVNNAEEWISDLWDGVL